MEFIVEHRMPIPSEYNELRRVVGWPVFEDSVVKKALANSLFGVCVVYNGSTIGMGRVLGDGAIYLHLQDVIIHSDFQKQGVGKILMKELMDFVTHTAGKNTNIGLMCSKGKEEFYKGFGFIERPNEKFGAGMIKIM